MDKAKINFLLYLKEREYQTKLHGIYTDSKSLSFPSFLLFLKEYIDRAINKYGDKWLDELPGWLTSCKEFEEEGYAPVNAYEELIKIFVLAGAALESYADINPTKWREEGKKEAKEKWGIDLPD